MSTKIYYAWRMPHVAFQSWLPWARDRMLTGIREIVMKYSEGRLITSSPSEYLSDVLTEDEEGAKGLRLWTAYTAAGEVLEATLDDGRIVFDLSCGLNVWIKEDFIYVIHYGWKGALLEDLKTLDVADQIEDYSYWNNTICTGNTPETDWNYSRLTYEVYDADSRISRCRIGALCGGEDFRKWVEETRAKNKASQ